jgi:hypothetical protein
VGKASMATYSLTKLASNAALFTCGIAAQYMLSSKPWTQRTFLKGIVDLQVNSKLSLAEDPSFSM